MLKNKKKYFSFGKVATRIKQTINMVEEWPEERNENLESKVKKLKPKESSKFV